MSTKQEILDVIKILRTAYPFAKSPDWPALMEMYTTHRVLSTVPIHILKEAVERWIDTEDFFPHRPGQLLPECYKIAGISPGMSFETIPEPGENSGPAWVNDELVEEFFRLVYMFYHGRVFFEADWNELEAKLKASNRDSLAQRVRDKRDHFVDMIENDYTPINDTPAERVPPMLREMR